MKLRRSNFITIALGLVMTLACAVSPPVKTMAASDTMKIVAIDLRGGNTGEATMISDGNGNSLLVDSGDNNNSGVFDWLDSNGYRNKRFDTLVTHWHDDHAGNTADIIRRYRVGTVYIPPTDYVYNETSSYYKYEASYARDIISAAKKRGTKIVYLKKGQTIKVGTIKGNVIACCASPKSENWYGVQYINNQSAVIMFTGGGVKLLTVGDIQAQTENRLLKSGVNLKADIYKMSHHGYDRSNTQNFIKAVDPIYAWFTSNTVTPSKYTSADVRDGVTRMGRISNVMSTRYNGTITYNCSGGEINVRAERNVIKMYQRFINKKTAAIKRVTFTFNDACTPKRMGRILKPDVYYNRQLNSDGSVFTGDWVTSNGKTYLKKNGIPAVNTFAVKNGKYYWFDISGKRFEKGFLTAYGKNYYMSPARATGWKLIDGRLYYFMDKKYANYSLTCEGMRMTGFKTIGGKLFYFQDTRMTGYKAADFGKRMLGFFTVSGKTYYGATATMKGYNDKIRGVIQTGWKTINDRLYYFGSDGVMRKGWQTIGGKRYYMYPGGTTAINRFVDVNGKRYYFNGSGIMQTGFKTISGKIYYFDQNGAMAKGIFTVSGKKYYANTSGVIAVSSDFTVDGKRYRADKTGAIIKEINCHLDANGNPVIGWHELNGKKYYSYQDGELATGTVTIDGKEYTFDTVQNGCALIVEVVTDEMPASNKDAANEAAAENTTSEEAADTAVKEEENIEGQNDESAASESTDDIASTEQEAENEDVYDQKAEGQSSDEQEEVKAEEASSGGTEETERAEEKEPSEVSSDSASAEQTTDTVETAAVEPANTEAEKEPDESEQASEEDKRYAEDDIVNAFISEYNERSEKPFENISEEDDGVYAETRGYRLKLSSGEEGINIVITDRDDKGLSGMKEIFHDCVLVINRELRDDDINSCFESLTAQDGVAEKDLENINAKYLSEKDSKSGHPEIEISKK